MAYARWADSSWYVYWAWSDVPPDSKEEEELYIHHSLDGYGRYTYKELKENEEDILFTVGVNAGATEDEVAELAIYINRFLNEVDESYERND